MKERRGAPQRPWTITPATSSTCWTRLHIEQAVIGGLSMGGYVTFALLRNAPAYFQGLLLADTRPPGRRPEGRQGARG
jgi:pimeloyl-ACP methyl ester carboxylesterase